MRGALLQGDLRFQWRHGFHAVYAVLLAVYVVGLSMVPHNWRGTLSGILVFSDTSVLGFFFVGSMTLLERQQRVLSVLAISPVPPRAWVSAKLLTLAGLAVAASVPLLVAGHGWTSTVSQLPSFLPAILLSSTLYTAIGIAVALRAATLGEYFFRGVLWTIIFVAPILPAFGVMEHPLWWALPTLPTLYLLGAIDDGPGMLLAVAILAAWTAAIVVLVYRQATSELRRPDAHHSVHHTASPKRAGQDREGYPMFGRLGAICRAELRLIIRDPLLTTVLLAPVLLLMLLRFAAPVVISVLATRWGFDLIPYTPLIAVFFLGLVPIMLGMVSSFVLLDELDEGVLAPISISPLNRLGWLFRKLMVVSLGTLPLVIALARLNGMHPVPWPALIASLPALGLQTPAVALLIATVARDKVEGVALSKATGILALAPIVVWYAPGLWALAGAPIPGIWVSLALLPTARTSAVSDGLWTTGTAATLITCGWLGILLRRFMTKQTGGA